MRTREKNKLWNKKKTVTKKRGSTAKVTSTKENAAKKKAKKKEQQQLDPKVIESKLKGRINSIPCSQKNKIQLEWPSKSISKIDEQIVAEKVVTEAYYGPLDAQQMSDIETHIKSTEMTISQAVSLRSALLSLKAMCRHERLRKDAKKICKQYQNGHALLDLAKKADQPPMNVFRLILSEMKWSKAAIKKALRDPKIFKVRERNEFLAAESMDVTSMVNQSEISEHSEEFEDLLSAWLEQKGIRFVRQKQLETEQKKEFGKAIVTPDFLLLDQVCINGTPCHWIDCKAYYGANSHFAIKNTRKQMVRYINRWGSGAILYLQGFSESIKIQDCVLLNAYGALGNKSVSALEAKVCAAKNTVSLTTFSDDEKENN